MERCSDDILEEILTRLPLKLIFRSKCVSKRWLNFISNPLFRIKRRRKFKGSGLLGFFQTRTFYSLHCTWKFMPVNIITTPLPKVTPEEAAGIINGLNSSFTSATDRHHGFLKFICSSNGLYLSHEEASNGKIYFVMNPLSKLVYQLPPSPKQMESFRELYPHGRPCVGLVAVDDDDDDYDRYKVVRADPVWGDDWPSGSNLIQIETFSSDTGEWQSSTLPVSVDVYNYFLKFRITLQKVTVIKGVIHWMSCIDSNGGIITYDPFNNVIEMVKPPPYFQERYYGFFFVLGESKDGLLQIAVLNQRSSQIGVWVFHSDCCEWSLRRRVSTLPYCEYPFIRRFPEFEPLLSLVAFHPHNPDALIINVGGSIFVCDLTTATPMLGEPLLQLPDNQCAITTITLQPYTLPPWPISPYPLPMLLETRNKYVHNPISSENR